MENSEKFKDQILAKLGNDPKLDTEIIEDIRKKTLDLGETLKEKDYEDTLCNVEIELSKVKDPQSVAGIIMYCMSKLPIAVQKIMINGQESILDAFLTKALTDILMDELKGKQ